jgi:hypothetical protein
MRTKDFYCRRDDTPWSNVYMYGTEAQMKKGRWSAMLGVCYHTFARVTKIKIKQGTFKRVRMTFEEIEE